MPTRPDKLADRVQSALWLGLGLIVVWLLARLSPILAPFLLAGILAYICNPLVDRLQALRMPRVLGVLAVLLLLTAIAAGLALILVPLLAEEATILVARLPDALALANEKLSPWLQKNLGIRLRFDPASLKRLVAENWDSIQAMGQHLYESLKNGGTVLLTAVLTLVLTPVALFYLLLDWHRLLTHVDHAIPRAWYEKTSAMARDVDAVLSQFLRGQLSVMLILAVYYSAALWIADLPSALAIGLLTGLLIFVPYLGYATGLLLALLVAALQFQGLGPIVAVLIVFGIGQVIEGFLLTPLLVGDRIGLHPLAVIFALMAFGQLFGFFGVLLALPASAALLVGLRELRAVYLTSRFYRGSEE